MPNIYNTSLQSDRSKAVNLIARWIQQCSSDERHKQLCNNILTVSHLPTRVLDVSRVQSSGMVYLIQNSQTRERYMTLSHCWGHYVPIRTTQANLSNMQNGIKLEDLPRTFRDAILVTVDLGITYIWIDSLCIIQDSKQDWEIESSRMASVYSSSFLNICASYAGDSTVGLFEPSQESDSDRIPSIYEIRRRRRTLSKSMYSIYAMPLNEHPSGWEMLHELQGPLVSTQHSVTRIN
jgi:hypothetical protein